MDSRFSICIIIFLVLLLPAVSAHFEESLSTTILDAGFWVFLGANALFFVIATWLLLWVLDRLSTRPHSALKEANRWLTWLFVLVVAYQVFHHIEHIAQVYQYVFVGLPALESAGILWFFNIEWNHFVFNAGYFIGLAVVLLAVMGILRRKRSLEKTSLALIMAALAVQGWHFLEHIVRIAKHMITGCEPCGGILDTLFGWGLIHLHFVFNTLALLLTVTAFFWFGFAHPTRWKKA